MAARPPAGSRRPVPAMGGRRSVILRSVVAVVAVLAVLAGAAVVVSLLRSPEPSGPPVPSSTAPPPSASAVALPPPTDTTVTLAPVADTFTDPAAPTTPQGGEPTMAVGGPASAFLRFDTSSAVPAGRILTGAVLRVFSTAAGTPAAPVAVHPARSTWKEETLAAGNRPAPVAKRLNRPVPAAGGAYADIPLTDVSTLRLDRSTDLEVRAPDGAGYVFQTRESAHPPQLTLTFTAEDPRADSPLPFDLPRAKMNSSRKLVFAHYFTPYPISIDNADPGSDYYARHYLRPEGENGKFAATGGLLRDRPIPRGPRGGNWEFDDMVAEVRQARAAGLDGFTLDLLSDRGYNWERSLRMLDAAAAVGNFGIVAMPDMNGLAELDEAGMARVLAEIAGKKAAFRLGDGRLVVSPFKAEGRSADWWRTTLSLLESRHGVRSAFVPTFLDWRGNARDFAPVSHGFSNWGNRSPASNRATARNAVDAHAMGKLWMQPVSVQDVRPNQAIYDEAANTENLRATWQAAIDGKAEWVQMVTWNDYSEGTSFAPSVAHGWTFLDISSYYIARLKTGSAPAIRRDALYLTHRKHRVGARPQKGSRLMTLRSDSTPARDTVEVLSFLPRKATIEVSVGGSTHRYVAPAGVHAQTFPLAVGRVSAVAERNGREVAKAVSPFAVTSRPNVQDLQYVGVSSRR